VKRDYSVLFVTEADRIHASSRVRVFQCVPHLERAGVRCEVINAWPTAALGKSRYEPVRAAATVRYPFRLVQILRRAGRHDLTYVNLVLFPLAYQRRLRARNRGIIFDFVDPIYTSSRHPGRLERQRQRRFEHMVRTASGVVTGNEPGREVASRYCARVLDVIGPVDTDRLRPRADGAAGDEVVIGWIGGSSTTRYLGVVRSALREVLGRYPKARLELLGADVPPLDGVPYTARRWSEATEADDLVRFDIGIMPLPDDTWTRGKGGYKILQYMAVGIPSVASPVGINADLVRDGENGFLARDERGWIAALSRLVEDAALRRRLGRQARSEVEARYSLKASVPRVLGLLDAAYLAGRR
jgi:glycosyltransferase involved in cell wall biosynthesis